MQNHAWYTNEVKKVFDCQRKVEKRYGQSYNQLKDGFSSIFTLLFPKFSPKVVLAIKLGDTSGTFCLVEGFIWWVWNEFCKIPVINLLLKLHETQDRAGLTNFGGFCCSLGFRFCVGTKTCCWGENYAERLAVISCSNF